MNWREERTYWMAGAAVLMLIAVFSIRSILQERDARIRLEEQIKATSETLRDRERALERLNEQIAANDARLKQSLDEIERLRKRPMPVREIVREIPRYIPMETPPSLTPATPEGGGGEPDAEPAGASFDASQLASLRDFYLSCTADRARLAACEENQRVWREKELTWQEKEKLLERQRDAVLRTARGGGFWRRLWEKTKWFGAGAVAGAAAGVALSR